jgi:arylsulfatase A-like enzyme
VYRTTTQTPWLVYHPALPDPGRRIEGRSMNVDVLPTIADLLGVAAPEGVNGASQKSALLGHTTKASHTYAYSETFFRRRHLSMVFDGEHQLIRTYKKPTETGPYTDQLYTAADWQANDDISLDAPQKASQLDEVLTEWEATSLALAAQGPEVMNDDVDASTDSMLKQLGYVD